MKPQLLKKRHPQQSEDDDYANYVALLSELVSLLQSKIAGWQEWGMIWQALLDMALTDPCMLPLDRHKRTEKLHVELRCYQHAAEEFVNNIAQFGSYY